MENEMQYIIMVWDISGCKIHGPYDTKEAAVTIAPEVREDMDGDYWMVFEVKQIASDYKK